MKAFQIKENIYWVGAIDWDLRGFHGYLTPRGSTYNAFLIIDEKIVLIDTVKHDFYDEMLSRISSIIDPKKIDYVISNHSEMDHSGSLPKIMEVCTNATVIASVQGEQNLKKQFKVNWDITSVKTNDRINIGKRNLEFIQTQLVHWPDSMATYIPEEKLLMPNDTFGQHMASFERFDEDFGFDIVFEEAKKYYANIMMPYANAAKRALTEIKKLDIEMIAPSHGLIWKKHVNDILQGYETWIDGKCENKAVIIFDTMWGSTELMAKAIYKALEEKGIHVGLYDLKSHHISEIATYLLDAKYIFVGSPTLNNNLLPTVASFLCYLKGLSPKNKTAMAFGSYGWGGQSVEQIEENLKSCGFEMLPSLKVQYVPDENKLKEIADEFKNHLG